jgi:hypothetical protein
MTAVVRLSDHRRKAPYLHFTRPELNRLLGLYASRVAKGEWRDYAINLGADAASFMVFRTSQEVPLFTISKLATGKGRSKTYNPRQGQYVVMNRQHKLCQGHALDDVLAVFDRPIKLVSG